MAMKFKIRRFIIVLLSLFTVLTSASASSIYGDLHMEEIELPEDLRFSVHNTCSEHPYFEQATARADGYFAVCTNRVKSVKTTKGIYSTTYIDIYDNNGDFLMELSFDTLYSGVVELTDSTVNIYSYSSVLVYDLETQELKNYALPVPTYTTSEIYKSLRSKEFVAGDWEYRCVKTVTGYRKLVRSNAVETQVLVEMSNVRENLNVTIVPLLFAAAAVGTSCFCIVVLLRKKKETENDSLS